MKKPPKLCRQKMSRGDDLAYVKINGKKIHLGKWNTPEAVEKYKRALAAWLTAKQLPAQGGVVASEDIEKIIELLTRIVVILEAKV